MQMGSFDGSKKSRFQSFNNYRQDRQPSQGFLRCRSRGIVETLRGQETGWLRKIDQKRALHEATIHLEEDLVIRGQLHERNCQVHGLKDTFPGLVFFCVKFFSFWPDIFADTAKPPAAARHSMHHSRGGEC